jgi:hypothetical protein
VSHARGLAFSTILMMEAGLIMQILIVGIYWPFVHESLMQRIRGLPNFTIEYWNSLFKHTYPAAAILANIMLSRIAFIRSHYIYCIRIGVIYAVFNYWGTLSRGYPLYPFLKWESIPETIAVCIALIAMACFIFLGVTKVVNSTKGMIGGAN